MKLKVLSIVVLLPLIFVWTAALSSVTGESVAVKGVIDLRDYSLEESIKLEGEWLFFWKELKSPSDTSVAGSMIVDFPKRWKYHTKERNLPSYGYATYKAKVLLPKTQKSIAIDMPSVYCAYSLYLNDSLVAVNGKVATNEEEFIPHWQNFQVDVPLVDTLNITLHVANFVHSKGGIVHSLKIGTKENIELSRKREEAVDLLLTGCLVMGGLFFLGLYLVGNRDKAILLFALFSIVYSYRVIGIDNYVLHSLFPNINWNIAIRLEYISLFLGIALFALYNKYLYSKDVNNLIIKIIVGLCF
ncbi:ATPase, partial [Pseudoxanthomonas sp. SGD-10]